MSERRSENSYINNDILPFLASSFGYPIHDADRVKINDIPIFRPSGGRAGSIDIVYYHNEEPVLLVEAKTKHKNHEAALKEALVYLKNFPIDRVEFAPSGLPPKILATTVGKEVKFYKWKIDYSKPIPDFVTEEIDVMPFEELISYYGLAKEYKARILEPKNFAIDFFDELISIFKYHKKEKKITKDIVKEVAYQIHNYLLSSQKYTGDHPYIDLDLQGQKAIRDLFKRYDFIASLGPEIAKEFRKAILRSFQGAEFNQYLTEKCVIDFIFGLIGKLSKHAKVLDFECGSGGFLAIAIDQNNLDLANVKGFDIEELPYIVAKTYFALYFRKIGEEMNLVPIEQDNGLLYHGKNWDLVVGNPAGSKAYPPKAEKGESQQEIDRRFDLNGVLTNLDRDLDKNGRDDHFSQYNFSIQQSIQSVRMGGKICLILPEGLFSNSQDELIRRYVAKHCNILAIISLPSGSFKKGTTVKQIKGGSQTASMKMSILYGEKIKEVSHSEGLDLDTRHLNYPIFLAYIDKFGSGSSDIGDWLEERLNVVLEQWQEWRNKAELKKLDMISTELNVEKVTKEPLKLLVDKVKIKKEKKIRLKEGKSEIKISASLEDLLK